MKFPLTVALALAVASSFAAPQFDTNGHIRVGNKFVPPSEIREKVKRIQLKRNGGYIRMPNSAKGQLVILNAQKRVKTSDLTSVRRPFDQWVFVNVAFKDSGPLTVATVAEALKKSGGTVGVGIVEDSSLPMLVTAPEAGWALVNVTKIAEDNPNGDILTSRVRKEVARGIAFVTGCAYMSRADPVMRDVAKPADLDMLPTDQLGGEIAMHMRESAPRYGLVPWYQATYLKACEEGWAPAPTNEYQQAIWDKVHATPKNPMKIEFDPKKGR